MTDDDLWVPFLRLMSSLFLCDKNSVKVSTLFVFKQTQGVRLEREREVQCIVLFFIAHSWTEGLPALAIGEETGESCTAQRLSLSPEGEKNVTLPGRGVPGNLHFTYLLATVLTLHNTE